MGLQDVKYMAELSVKLFNYRFVQNYRHDIKIYNMSTTFSTLNFVMYVNSPNLNAFSIVSLMFVILFHFEQE